jgi:hypothetical protein
VEDQLEELARDREQAYHSTLSQMRVDHPATLRKQLRAYLGEQADHDILARTYDDVPRLETNGELNELVCDEVEFRSDSRLEFRIQMEKEQRGWSVRRFRFHLRFAGRPIGMVRIHLNEERDRAPLRVPRCHLHVDSSEPHIPFPIMDPRLILHLICERIEPHIGLPEP